MKAMSAAFFLLMVSGLFSNLSAQSQNNSSPTSDADRTIIAESADQTNQQTEARIENDRLILPVDERNALCAYLRVYRVKRDIPGSDATRPAGYTTCVGASRFTMKSSAKPQAERTPTESIEAK
jgi:hypothetical protein